MISQLARNLGITFQIDTNRINSRGGLPGMNQLEHWHKNRVIYLEMSEVAQKEIESGRDLDRKQKAWSYIYSETLATSPDEQTLLKNIEAILCPNGPTDSNSKNDIEIVFNAHKYGGGRLITKDGGSKRQPGGILGHKAALSELGIAVMTDDEAFVLVKEQIARRDAMVLSRHEKYGLPLPDWYGKD